MKTLTIPASDLKNKTARVLNQVAYGQATVIVERFGRPVAKIVPVLGKETDLMARELNKTFGKIPDFPNVRSERKFTRKAVSLWPIF